MLETLKFVKAAISKDENQPILRCFKIRNLTVSASNGALTIQAPIAIDLNCAPLAEQFYRALSVCDSTPSLHLDAGKLIVKSGKFKSAISCMDDATFPDVHPSGPILPIKSPILPILKALLPFVSTDETRPWACGILFSNNSAYATNNAAIVEHWIPVSFPAICNIPLEAIKELVRLNIEPLSIQPEAQRVTFHLPDQAWISCLLSVRQWPVGIFQVLADTAEHSGPWMAGESLERFREDVAKLSGFGESRFPRLRFRSGHVATISDKGAESTVETAESPGSGVFLQSQLECLKGVEKIGWNAYPKPVPFFGKNFRGVLACYQEN